MEKFSLDRLSSQGIHLNSGYITIPKLHHVIFVLRLNFKEQMAITWKCSRSPCTFRRAVVVRVPTSKVDIGARILVIGSRCVPPTERGFFFEAIVEKGIGKKRIFDSLSREGPSRCDREGES